MSWIGIGLIEFMILLMMLTVGSASGQPQGTPSAPAKVEGTALSTDLALVHPNALGFVHIRVTDIWNDPSMEDARRIFRQAGPTALAALDKFSPAPSTVERLTAVVWMPREKPEPTILVAVAFQKAVDVAQMTKQFLPEPSPARSNGKMIVVSNKAKLAIHFADSKHILIGEPDSVVAYLAEKPDTGLLEAPLRSATTHPLTIAVNLKSLPFPAGMMAQLPPEAVSLLQAERATLTMTMGERSTWNLSLSYPNVEAASQGNQALKRLAQMAKGLLQQPRQELNKQLVYDGNTPRPMDELPMVMASVIGLGMLTELEKLLDQLPITQESSDLKLTIRTPAWLSAYAGSLPIAVGLALPAVQKVREAAGRTQSMNNMKQITLALHNYSDANGHFPPAAICDKAGKPLLSWRVAILPYIEQEALYRQFKLDEPWDSKHNLPLSKSVVKIFSDPLYPSQDQPELTPYKAIVGTNAAFQLNKSHRFADFTDGTSNTVLIIADSGNAVPWTKPDDLPFDPDAKMLPKLGGHFEGGFNAAFCDGSVRFLKSTIALEVLKAIITQNGGEVIGKLD